MPSMCSCSCCSNNNNNTSSSNNTCSSNTCHFSNLLCFYTTYLSSNPNLVNFFLARLHSSMQAGMQDRSLNIETDAMMSSLDRITFQKCFKQVWGRNRENGMKISPQFTSHFVNISSKPFCLPLQSCKVMLL